MTSAFFFPLIHLAIHLAVFPGKYVQALRYPSSPRGKNTRTTLTHVILGPPNMITEGAHQPLISLTI